MILEWRDGSGPHDPPLALQSVDLILSRFLLSQPQKVMQNHCRPLNIFHSVDLWMLRRHQNLEAVVSNPFSTSHFPLKSYCCKSSLSWAMSSAVWLLEFVSECKGAHIGFESKAVNGYDSPKVFSPRPLNNSESHYLTSDICSLQPTSIQANSASTRVRSCMAKNCLH